MRKVAMTATLTVVPKDEQQSVIWFLMLENVSNSEIHVRMCVVYGIEKVITKSTVNQGYSDSRWDKRVRATNLEALNLQKEGPGVVWYATGINKLINP